MVMNLQKQYLMMNMEQSLLSMHQLNPKVTKFNRNKHFKLNSNQIHSVNFRPQMVPINRSYGIWEQQFQNPNLSSDAMTPRPSAFNKSLGPRSNWKGKRVNKPIGGEQRMEQLQQSLFRSGGIGPTGGNLMCRKTVNQNRLKSRKTYPKKKFNKNMDSINMGGNGGRSVPFAPRNTTSFLIRAKRSGGIASVASPFPVTPCVLPTPILSPCTEVLGNMAKEEWGVDGYGSMKGLIRLRSIGLEDCDEEEDEGSSSSSSSTGESDVEEHVEMERRVAHDLSRFEMIYVPNSGSNDDGKGLENEGENRIAELEEENRNMKEKLLLMEGELGDLRRRLMSLDSDCGGEEEVVEIRMATTHMQQQQQGEMK